MTAKRIAREILSSWSFEDIWSVTEHGLSVADLRAIRALAPDRQVADRAERLILDRCYRTVIQYLRDELANAWNELTELHKAILRADRGDRPQGGDHGAL